MDEKNVRVADVAKETGIHRGTVSRLRNETAIRVDFDVLETLCRHLGCEIGDLIEIKD
jgi:putative transcriptional regulator